MFDAPREDRPVNRTATADAAHDVQGLAGSLAPTLYKQCTERLHDIVWFRTDWQRGGAATGRAQWREANQTERDVVVKLPVGQGELQWLRRLSTTVGASGITPQLFESGDTLGSYDLAWVVMEYLPIGPLALRWNDRIIDRIARAASRFYQAASQFPVDQCPLREDWDELIARSRRNLRTNAIDQRKRWNASLKGVTHRLSDLLKTWRSRDCNDWIHGDLHPANAMARTDEPEAEVCLIDLAEVRAGHWLEDAIYLERLLWGAPERLKATKPVRAIARARRNAGFTVDKSYTHLAHVRRALLAATAPGFMKSEGDPHHLRICLEHLEHSLAAIR